MEKYEITFSYFYICNVKKKQQEEEMPLSKKKKLKKWGDHHVTSWTFFVFHHNFEASNLYLIYHLGL